MAYTTEAFDQNSLMIVERDTSVGAKAVRPEMVIRNPAGATGTSIIGGTAHDGAAASVNPLLIGGYASSTTPSDVSADNDAVRAWFLRNGALATYMAYALNVTDDAVVAYPDGLALRPTITTTDAAYSAGDVIGGILTLAAPLASGSPVALRSIVLKDDQNQKPALQLLFFRSSPAGTYTDNAAVAPSTADMGALVYCHTVAAADWVTIQGTTKAVVSYDLDDGPVLGPATTSLFLVIVAGATPPDYGANATDLTAELGFVRAT